MAVIPSTLYGNQGQLINWSRNASNNGVSTSTNVKMTVTIPNTLSIVTYNVTKGSFNPTTKVWTIGTLGAGELATISVNLITNTIPTGDLNILSELTGTGLDSNPTNNNATDTLTLEPLDSIGQGFLVNEETAYVSLTRNLNNVIGTPRLGDISRVFNPNTSGFAWNTLNVNSGAKNIFLFRGSYGTVSLTNKTLEASNSNFVSLVLDSASKATDVNDVTNLLTVKNNSRVYSKKISGNILLQGNSAEVNSDEVSGLIEIAGEVSGKFTINATSVTGSTNFRANNTNAPSFAIGTTININIGVLDNILRISNINLSGVNVNIKIDSTTDKGKLRFENITVNDDTNINVTGNFYDDGNEPEFYVYPEIGLVSAENEGVFSCRINVSNSTFKISVASAISSSLGANLGFNIFGCKFISLGGRAIMPYGTANFYVSNSITNEPVGSTDYSTNPLILGTIIQDENLL